MGWDFGGFSGVLRWICGSNSGICGGFVLAIWVWVIPASELRLGPLCGGVMACVVEERPVTVDGD